MKVRREPAFVIALLMSWVSIVAASAAEKATIEAPYETQVFVSGQDGYHTYRIPAIIVSGKGTLLAFCEGRKHSRADDGDIDLVLRRSFDNGRTWQKMQVIRDDGENTIGNPSPVLDRDSGTVWLLFCRNNEKVFATKSTDDGATWASPTEVTADVKLPLWKWYATGPVHGIQLSTGRLLIPCDHTEPGSPEERRRSHVIYSDDHGSTWKLGGVLGEKTNECVAVETLDGGVYLNMRSYHGKNRRAYAWSRDGGATWSDVMLDETLIEPVCQASAVRFTDERRHDKNRVLFSNPAGKLAVPPAKEANPPALKPKPQRIPARERLTVRISYDECKTWNEGKVLYDGPSAYSDMCIAPDMTICCLYERGKKHPYEEIIFARFTLEWLTDGADSLGRNR